MNLKPKKQSNEKTVIMTCKRCKRQFHYTEDFAKLIRNNLDPFAKYLGLDEIICFNCNGKG